MLDNDIEKMDHFIAWCGEKLYTLARVKEERKSPVKPARLNTTESSGIGKPPFKTMQELRKLLDDFVKHLPE